MRPCCSSMIFNIRYSWLCVILDLEKWHLILNIDDDARTIRTVMSHKMFFLHKNGPINVDCHIYKILSCFKWPLKIIIFWKNPNWETERQISLVLWIRKFLKYVTMWKGFHIALFPFLALRKLMIQGVWIHAKTLRMKIW